VEDKYSCYEQWKAWEVFGGLTEETREYLDAECGDLLCSGAQILEVGFGSGEFLEWARRSGGHVAGIEVNARLLSRAKQQGFEVFENIETAGEGGKRTYDFVAAFDVLEHLQLNEIEEFLDSARQLVAEGGTLVVRVPNCGSPFGWVHQGSDPTHQTPLSLASLDYLARRSGFFIARGSAAARVYGHGFFVKCVRKTRYFLRDSLARILGFIFGVSIIWDPVITARLQVINNVDSEDL